MKRVMLRVAYDGTEYCGWQVQPNGITVQEVLNRELSSLTGEPIHTIGASRTDAGVHALGNVAVFDTNARMPGERYSYALNTRLPEDIRIQGSREVPAEFHPRYTETVKTYEYRILNREFPDPILRRYSLFDYNRLDFDGMREAAEALKGEHNFRSFQSSAETNRERGTVRTIYRTELLREARVPAGWESPGRGPYQGLITFRITGNGFLYNMVRIIAGTILAIGKGQLARGSMPSIIEAHDRAAAGPTAPAHGLTLVEIRYPEWENIK